MEPSPTKESQFNLETDFQPDQIQVQELVDKIITLKDGDAIVVTHSFLIVKHGLKTLAFDISLLGRQFKPDDPKEAGKLLPPGGGDEFRTIKRQEAKYSHTSVITPHHSLNDQLKSPAERFGEILGQYIDEVFISHLDGDHVDFEVLRKMLETNPKLTIHGPKNWQKYIEKQHSAENDSKPKKHVLPETLKKRMSDSKGLILWEKQGESYSIKFIQVPHFGSPLTVEDSQGFCLEGPNYRIMIISDCSLSPEIIMEISKFHKPDEKREKIFISTASIHPETIYGLGSIKFAEWERNQIDEGLFHTAHLLLVAHAMTGGQAEIISTHKGFYYRGSRKKELLRFKFPKISEDDEQSWSAKLKMRVLKVFIEMQSSIVNLGPLPLKQDGKILNPIKLVKDVASRIRFAREIVNWIQNEGVPDTVLEKIQIPGQNQLIK